MDDQAPNYHREFARSPHHAALAFLTLGLGFLSAQVLGLIAGVTAYVLGWIYLPDSPWFRRWVGRRQDTAKRAEDARKVAEFIQRREKLLRSLALPRRERYQRLALVCRDIETASADSPLASPDPASDPRLRKLDELMWTYLRLLGIEESLDLFLQTERREDVPSLVGEGEAEVTRLKTEFESAKAKGDAAAIETKQRYLGSRMDRLEVLRKRLQRCQQAEANLALAVSEEERLDQQVKLIRADAVATKNTETLTARIDASVEHLDQTNKWLSELDEFKDLVGDLPATELRVGYQAPSAIPVAIPLPTTAAAPTAAPAPPPIIDLDQVRKAQPLKQRQRQ